MTAVCETRLTSKLKGIAVRILKKSITASSRAHEMKAAETVSRLPANRYLLQEQSLTPGVTISRLYDENLKTFVESQLPMHPTRRAGIEYVLSAVANAISHLHKYNLGHFDIKPSNILIKWARKRGYFEQADVVLADFGLSCKFTAGGTSCCMRTAQLYNPSCCIQFTLHIYTTKQFNHFHTPQYACRCIISRSVEGNTWLR